VESRLIMHIGHSGRKKQMILLATKLYIHRTPGSRLSEEASKRDVVKFPSKNCQDLVSWREMLKYWLCTIISNRSD
jgi:hypothetical protein